MLLCGVNTALLNYEYQKKYSSNRKLSDCLPLYKYKIIDVQEPFYIMLGGSVYLAWRRNFRLNRRKIDDFELALTYFSL